MKKENIGEKIVKICVVVFLVVFVVGSSYLLGSIFGNKKVVTNSDYETLSEVINYLSNNFYYGEDGEVYKEKLITDAINGMVDAQKDPYTDYMTPEEMESFTSSLSSNFVGIGVSYKDLDGNILVIRVIPDSPAEKAGVLEGDIIIKVDGVYCNSLESDELVNRIRGQKGTTVVITVLRENQEMEISIVRDVVSNTVYSEVLENNIGYLQLTSFADGTAKEVATHLSRLAQKNVKDLIIDLRDNTGGYLSTLQQICSCFMEPGTVIMREYFRDGSSEEVKTINMTNTYTYNNIIILTNEYSASCSEVFVCAMKEVLGAKTVGTSTYGKGVAQITYYLSDGGALKYTDCIWKSPSDVDISGEGIAPDYEVYLHEALYESYLVLTDQEVIKYDSVDTRTVTIQKMLDFLGYKVDRKDGYYSAATQNAIKKFQASLGIEVTGNVDVTTANALNSKVVSEWSLNTDKYDTQLAKAIEILK